MSCALPPSLLAPEESGDIRVAGGSGNEALLAAMQKMMKDTLAVSMAAMKKDLLASVENAVLQTLYPPSDEPHLQHQSSQFMMPSIPEMSTDEEEEEKDLALMATKKLEPQKSLTGFVPPALLDAVLKQRIALPQRPQHSQQATNESPVEYFLQQSPRSAVAAVTGSAVARAQAVQSPRPHVVQSFVQSDKPRFNAVPPPLPPLQKTRRRRVECPSRTGAAAAAAVSSNSDRAEIQNSRYSSRSSSVRPVGTPPVEEEGPCPLSNERGEVLVNPT
ncbi:unnamed protein product [Polarella glacialis]|uniref:Uncharacterized protein n=1 Tax=Polarella glacialis TaxID=89957 RepID=A0A813KP33_POLGL|nr:unnamed protein product [Polarella glacialis]